MEWARKYAGIIAVAMVTAAVTAAGPAIAHGVGHALFAHEADEVDGRDAVGAGAEIGQRPGKLVATDKDGYLPNNIIRRAADSDLLDGLDARAFAAANHSHETSGPYWASSYLQDNDLEGGAGAYTFISVANLGTGAERVTLRFLSKDGALICDTSQTIEAGATWVIATGSGGGPACTKNVEGRMEVQPASGAAGDLLPWAAVVFVQQGITSGFTLTWTRP